MSGITVKAALSNQCYASHMREIMEELFSTRETADVTIVTDDKFEVMAHKEVLKASSGFFKNYLGSYSQPKQLVFLRGVRYLELNALLRFIYLGDTQVSSERYRHFIQVGKDLEIKGIDIIEQEEARKENQRQYETVNCEMEYARVLSEGLSDQEKTRMENKSQYETVNCEIEYSKVLSEGLHDQEDKAETFTEINEDDYDYYQALANQFSPDSSDTEIGPSIKACIHSPKMKCYPAETLIVWTAAALHGRLKEGVPTMPDEIKENVKAKAMLYGRSPARVMYCPEGEDPRAVDMNEMPEEPFEIPDGSKVIAAIPMKNGVVIQILETKLA